MSRADAKVRAAIVLGLLLSVPVVRGYFDGTIPLTAAAIRTAIALALAYAGVLLVTTVVGGYLPQPQPEEQAAAELEGVEEAVLVDEHAIEEEAS